VLAILEEVMEYGVQMIGEVEHWNKKSFVNKASNG